MKIRKILNRRQHFDFGSGQLFSDTSFAGRRTHEAEKAANRQIMSGGGVPRRNPWDSPQYPRWDPHRGWWHGEPKEQTLF